MLAALRILGILLLLALALILGALALGAFASLNYAAPLWLRTLSLPEGLISTRLGLGGIDTWLRALALTLAAVLAVFIAAWWPPVAPKVLAAKATGFTGTGSKLR